MKWYMESVGPLQEKGDIFLYIQKPLEETFTYVGIILSMDTHTSKDMMPCLIVEVECTSSKEFITMELFLSTYYPKGMTPSMNGIDGSFAKMGWELHQYVEMVICILRMH